MAMIQVMLGLVEWLFCSAVIGIAAALLVRRVELKSTAMKLLSWLFVSALLTMILVFCTGLAGVFSGPALTIICGLGIGVYAFFRKRGAGADGGLWGDIFVLRSDVLTALQEWRVWARENRGFAIACLVVVGLMVLRIIAHTWFLPPYIWDTLSYHLPRIADWVQHAEIVTVDTPVVRTYWPAGFELFQAWFVVFLHHDALIELAGVPFLLMAVLSVYIIAVECGVRKRLALWAGILFWGSPGVTTHVVSCKNDLSIAAVFLLIVAVLLYGRHERRLAGWSVFVSVLAGLYALGAKPYIAFLAPGLAVVFLWCVWRGEWTVKDLFRGSLPGWCVCGLLVVTLVVASFWYVRNAAMFDNPFYPTDVRVAGASLDGEGAGSGQQGRFDVGSMQQSFRNLWDSRLFEPEGRYTADLGGMSGWGWVAVGLGGPAAMWMFVASGLFRLLLVVFCGSLAFLLGWVDPDPWNFRFTLWFPAVFCVAVVGVYERLSVGVFRSAFACLLIAGGLANFIDTLDNGYIRKKEKGMLVAHSIGSRSAALLAQSNIQVALAKVPDEEPIGYFADGSFRTYALYGAGFRRQPVYVKFLRHEPLHETATRRGVRYVLTDTTDRYWRKRINAEVRAGYLEKVGQDVYRVIGGGDGS